MKETGAFRKLAESNKKDVKERVAEESAGRAEQEAILKMLAAMPQTLFKDAAEFEKALDAATKRAALKLAATIRKAIFSALSEGDETAEIVRGAEGGPEPDPELRDYENVPLREDVREYFKREVAPHLPDAWVNEDVRDEKDGEIGIVGYEMNFNRYFYKYVPPRQLDEIESDIRGIETGIVAMLREISG